jgi:hypothetical protein
VEIILLDWTRMGRLYCLAGAIRQAGQIRIVRPLPPWSRESAFPHGGWSAWQMDGHSRWEVFEMTRPAPAASLPPHLEDVQVQSLRPLGRLAPPEQRRAVLEATLAPPGKPLFGVELARAHDARYLSPGEGQRSLASVEVPASGVQFTALWRDGAEEPDCRVRLPLSELDSPILPVKTTSCYAAPRRNRRTSTFG